MPQWCLEKRGKIKLKICKTYLTSIKKNHWLCSENVYKLKTKMKIVGSYHVNSA